MLSIYLSTDINKNALAINTHNIEYVQTVPKISSLNACVKHIPIAPADILYIPNRIKIFNAFMIGMLNIKIANAVDTTIQHKSTT